MSELTEDNLDDVLDKLPHKVRMQVLDALDGPSREPTEDEAALADPSKREEDARAALPLAPEVTPSVGYIDREAYAEWARELYSEVDTTELPEPDLSFLTDT